MSYLLNQPLLQMCFAVDDVDEACKKWSEAVGAGPWARYPAVGFKSLHFKGKPSDMQQGGAVGYWGPIEIELYRRNDGDPAHCVFPKYGEPAFHHLCMMAKPGEYENEIKRLEGMGYKRIWECEAYVGEEGEVNDICWFDTRELNGAMIELYKYNETMLKGKEGMRLAHEHWDGKELFVSYTPDPEK